MKPIGYYIFFTIILSLGTGTLGLSNDNHFKLDNINTSAENSSYHYSEEINENYTLIFEAQVFNSRGEIDIILEDYSNNQGKNYIFLEGVLKEESTTILTLSPGSHSIVRTNNFSGHITYLISIHFFDRVNGDQVLVTKNIKNFTIVDGNVSEYAQTVPQRLNLTNANSTLVGEYNPFNTTQFLYHFNESFGEPIDSSFNNWDSLRVGILPNNMYGATGKFMTDAYLFNRGLGHGINVDSQYNFTNEISIDYWFNKNLFGNQDYNESVFSRNDSSIFAGFRYEKVGMMKYFHFHLVDENDTEYILEFQNNILTGTYYHVAYTYDNDTMRIFVNGHVIASNQIGSINIKNSSSNYTIGYRNDTNYYNGILEELRVENRNVTQFNQTILNNLYYNDTTTLEINTTTGYLEYITSFDATFLGSNLSHMDVVIYYENNNASVNITNEQLFAYNYGNDSFVEFDYFPNLIPDGDYISNDSEIMILLNYTANVSTFILEFDYLILNGYFPANITNLNWSYMLDDTRIVMFQNTTTNTTSFEVEFDVDDPLEDIFESETVYAFKLSEGNISTNVNANVYFWNASTSSYFLADSFISRYEECPINDNCMLLISGIPLSLFDDIIFNNTEKQMIKFVFDFSSDTAKMFLDLIEKTTYYMNRSDFVDYSNDIDIQYFRTEPGNGNGGDDDDEPTDTGIINPFAANPQLSLAIIIILGILAVTTIVVYNLTVNRNNRGRRRRK